MPLPPGFLPAGHAPAKINLTLHITGRRDDGYHLLDSLVAFAGLVDEITAQSAVKLTLTVDGPFKQGVPVDDSNLILKAAQTLQTARNVTAGAAIRLTKALPHAAGIGSASSDAAATIRLLADLWQVPPLRPTDAEVAALGGDVPVCLAGPLPRRMGGIGHLLAPVPALPPMALVLVNPGAQVPTRDVFAALDKHDGDTMQPLPPGLSLPAFCTWLGEQRNDLTAAACTIAPEIGVVLGRLRSLPQVLHAGMSGSGATCFGIVRDIGAARAAARVLQISQQGWWVAPATLIGAQG